MLPQSFNYILSAFLNYQNFCDNEYLGNSYLAGRLAVLILKRIVVCNNVQILLFTTLLSIKRIIRPVLLSVLR